MTTNATRAAILLRALHARIESDVDAIREIYTDDVRAWTPTSSSTSLSELVTEFERRDDTFSDIELETAPLDVGGEYACVEWTVTMTHNGRLAVADGEFVEPTGLRVTAHGVTVAEFRGEQICSLRQYWDELALFEQLGVAHTGAS